MRVGEQEEWRFEDLLDKKRIVRRAMAGKPHDQQRDVEIALSDYITAAEACLKHYGITIEEYLP